MNKIGVMQGRLLPKLNGLYQAHPIGYWQDEFYLSQQHNLDVIQFILDFNESHINPLLTEKGLQEIKYHIDKSGVCVDSICADYFMAAPLHSLSDQTSNKSLEILKQLILNGSKIGVDDIIIPCVEISSLKTLESQEKFIKIVSTILDLLEKFDVNLSLETDFAPEDFVDFVSQFDSDKIKINYDTGNSASLGYDINEELDIYGNLISNIHLKDRLLGGGPCLFGKGNVNFEVFFDKLSKLNYEGSLIFQAFRDEEGVGVFKQQYEWILPLLNKYKKNKESYDKGK